MKAYRLKIAIRVHTFFSYAGIDFENLVQINDFKIAKRDTTFQKYYIRRRQVKNCLKRCTYVYILLFISIIV